MVASVVGAGLHAFPATRARFEGAVESTKLGLSPCQYFRNAALQCDIKVDID
jgi:hypothetical protein